VSGKKPDRVFLDANVLFSAAYLEHSGLLQLWNRDQCALLTSGYAAEEARRNLRLDDQRDRLEKLLGKLEILAEASDSPGEEDWGLPEKDAPILRAAIHAAATHLLTGDLRHFGHLIGTRIYGVLIVRPATYLRS